MFGENHNFWEDYILGKMEKSQKRQTAYKVRINDILKGEYIKEEGEWVPNYIKAGGRKVSRVNLIAVVVSKQSLENTNYQNIIIDDGSGRISIRSFDEGADFNNISVGDFVLVIGRPREYFNEKYIVSEILKKIEDRLWVDVRKLELEGVKGEEKESSAVYKSGFEKEEGISEEQIEEEDITGRIFKLIKESDGGGGADMQEVITKLNLSEGEKVITRLLEGGEVFEVKPGRLKVLE